MPDRYNDDEEEYMGDKLEAPSPDFDGGPLGASGRSCTDIFCALLLVAVWIAMSFVGYYSISNGDARLLLYPLDYDGNICGTNYNGTDMTDYPFLYTINYWHTGICLKECPVLSENIEMNNTATTTNTTSAATTKVVNYTSDGLTDIRTLITYNGLHQIEGSEYDVSLVEVPDFYTNESNVDALSCDIGENNILGVDIDLCFPEADNPLSSWTSIGINRGQGFAYYLAESKPILKYCTISQRARDAISAQVRVDDASLTFIDEGLQLWKNIYSDIYTARYYVLGCGFGLSLVISLCYIGILRLPILLNFVIWGSLFVSIGLVSAAGYFAAVTAQKWSEADPQHFSDNYIQFTRVSSYVLYGLAGLMFVIMVCLRREIQLAIGCVKETAKAVQRMPMILLIPVLQGFAFIVFVVIFCVYSTYLASLGEVNTNEIRLFENNNSSFLSSDNIFTQLTNLDEYIQSFPPLVYRTYNFNDEIWYAGWGMLFAFFWTGNFIITVGDMVMAMAIAQWYFTRDKKQNVGNGTVWSSLCKVLFYHLGTVAFGSLLLAIVQFLRAILVYIQKKAKEVGGKYGEKAANIILCCCQCCLWCFENCIRFWNKNAYIQTAIFGRPFCTAAKDAFFLILRNMGRIGSISYVSGFVLWIGKIFISTVTTLASYYAMVEYIADDLHSIAAPTTLVFLLSYFLADMFLDVFEMSISTILHCFVADEEMFTGEACYAEGSLQRWIDKHQRK